MTEFDFQNTFLRRWFIKPTDFKTWKNPSWFFARYLLSFLHVGCNVGLYTLIDLLRNLSYLTLSKALLATSHHVLYQRWYWRTCKAMAYIENNSSVVSLKRISTDIHVKHFTGFQGKKEWLLNMQKTVGVVTSQPLKPKYPNTNSPHWSTYNFPYNSRRSVLRLKNFP